MRKNRNRDPGKSLEVGSEWVKAKIRREKLRNIAKHFASASSGKRQKELTKASFSLNMPLGSQQLGSQRCNRMGQTSTEEFIWLRNDREGVC